MSVNFSPNIASPCSNLNCKPAQRPACDVVSTTACYGDNKPEMVAKAEFIGPELRIATAMKGLMDSNVWYRINQDGSALFQTAWCPGKDIKAGTYSDVYQEAQKRKEANGGTLTDEDAVALAEQIKETDIITKNGV